MLIEEENSSISTEDIANVSTILLEVWLAYKKINNVHQLENEKLFFNNSAAAWLRKKVLPD